jgi:addiction module RelE/StbE family toxin
MKITYTERFKKNFNKLPVEIQNRFSERLEIFIQNPDYPLLRVHPLKGNLAGLRAFSITGDYRAIYFKIHKEAIEFVDIGTHNQVY